MDSRIKIIREITSLTQDEVSKYLGITREKYAGIELGVFPPTLEILNQLAKLFNVSVKTLTENIKELNYTFKLKENNYEIIQNYYQFQKRRKSDLCF